LIATDGSKSAEHAAALDIKFAQQYGAMVYAIYVINVTASDAILIDEAWAAEECEACEKTCHRVTSFVLFIKSIFNFSFLYYWFIFLCISFHDFFAELFG
jgi:hypothetical protein